MVDSDSDSDSGLVTSARYSDSCSDSDSATLHSYLSILFQKLINLKGSCPSCLPSTSALVLVWG